MTDRPEDMDVRRPAEEAEPAAAEEERAGSAEPVSPETTAEIDVDAVNAQAEKDLGSTQSFAPVKEERIDAESCYDAGTSSQLMWGARTDVGCVRSHNEDSYLVQPPLFVVSDGMGGHAAGEVASGIAVETISRMAPSSADPALLGRAVEAANISIIDAAESGRGKPGMGCTADAAFFEKDKVAIAHVGDSRVYLLHEGALIRVTHDHSYVEELVDAGEITADEARVHPSRSIITRALGSDPEMYADHFTLDIENGDRVIICSDGLSSMVPDSLIEDLAISSAMPQQAADNLVAEALAQGGHDNVTVIVIDVTDDGSRAIRRRRRRRTVIGWLAGLAVVCALAAAAAMLFVLNSWYIGANGGYVAIYRGVQGNFLGIATSSLAEGTTISLEDLPESTQHSLERGIGVSSLEEAERTVDGYRDQIDAEKTRAAAAADDAKAQGADTQTSAVQTAAAPTTKSPTTTKKAGE